MTREERRALLGDTVIAQIHERVAEVPAADAPLCDELRRILTRPAKAHKAMTPEECRAVLGDQAIAQVREHVTNAA